MNQAGFIEMSVPQYAADQGISASTVRRRCENGQLDAYQISEGVKGSHWIIKVPRGDTVNRHEYETLLRENTMLREKLEGARRALSLDKGAI